MTAGGFAPQILTLTKMACLNYVNSPVKYGNQDFEFGEIITIKDKLLKSLQQLGRDQEEILKNKES